MKATYVLVFSELLISSYVIVFNNTYAQVNPDNTLESVASNEEVLGGIVQIPTGESPIDIEGSLGEKRRIYVVNSESDSISVIDTTTNTVKQNIPVGEDPQDALYVTGVGRYPDTLLVTNHDSDSITVIDPATNTVTKNIPVGKNPNYIAYTHGSVYVANSGSDFVSVIDPATNTVTKNITVGLNPQFINGYAADVYVANGDSNTVSVIDPATNTVTKTIPVGKNPKYILVDEEEEREVAIYVANQGSGFSFGGVSADTVSVIDPDNHTLTKTIPVGEFPREMLLVGTDLYVSNVEGIFIIDTRTNTVTKNIPWVSGHMRYSSPFIYVANDGPGNVAVIDQDNHTLTKTIPVGERPSRLYVDRYSDALYVSNTFSGSISVINRETNEVVAGITFVVSPFRGGVITCNTPDGEVDAPINRFLFISSTTKCVAKPSKGFEFSSWVEVLGGNSTRTVNATSGSPWTAFLDTFNLKPGDPAATLNINRFGNFTAYFRALPPAIPSEYLIPLYGIIVSTVVGLSIPSIITWRKTKKQTSRLNSYHQKMTKLYDDGELDENDAKHLNLMNKNITNAYSEGKINNEQYSNLKNEISALYEEIYRKRLNSLKESSNKDIDQEVIFENIQEEIRDAYSKGKVSELHYNLLNERIAKMKSKNDERE